MVLYQFTTVKKVLGDSGTTNDVKIMHYGSMADTAIIADLINVRGMTNPPTVVVGTLTQSELDDIKDFATQYTVGYFYKFESGDELTIEEAKLNWTKWFNSKFRRQNFVVRGGELSR
jgi:hypothetical protein|tara:strand:+ start:1475 stop:1825 length:351 start_codon:yes stop_codon:yes gene_type:complete